jgi:putative oxidoreductase
MIMGFLSKYSPQILGVLRILVGLLFLEHGLMKIVGFPAPMGQGPLPPMIMAAGIIEIIGGTLIALGLFSRYAAFITSGEMAFAYFIAHFPRGIYPAMNGGGRHPILFHFPLFGRSRSGGLRNQRQMMLEYLLQSAKQTMANVHVHRPVRGED